ncbi:hypothetical protein CLAIMM_04349, partial [Cladophialophora immunda]
RGPERVGVAIVVVKQPHPNPRANKILGLSHHWPGGKPGCRDVILCKGLMSTVGGIFPAVSPKSCLSYLQPETHVGLAPPPPAAGLTMRPLQRRHHPIGVVPRGRIFCLAFGREADIKTRLTP